jgi:hypothetical protein
MFTSGRTNSEKFNRPNFRDLLISNRRRLLVKTRRSKNATDQETPKRLCCDRPTWPVPKKQHMIMGQNSSAPRKTTMDDRAPTTRVHYSLNDESPLAGGRFISNNNCG